MPLPVLAVLLSFGCAAPPYVPPEPVKPTAPLSLEAAVDLAIRNNPDVQAAAQRVQAASAAIFEAWSYYWPVLQAMERITQTDQPSRAFGSILDQRRFDNGLNFNDPGVTTNFRAGITGSITLYDAGRRRARVLQAQAGAESAAASGEAVRRDIALETAKAFFLIFKAREASATQEQSIGTLETHLRITEARLDLGAVLRSDVLAVQVRLAETREAAIVARNAALRAESGLRILLGLEIADPLALVPPATPDLGPRPDLGLTVARARRSRPEILRAGSDVMVAEAKVKEVYAGYFPEVTVFGDFGFDSRHPSLNHSNWFWGVSFIESIFDAFRAPARVRQAMANLAAVHAAGRKVVLEVEHEVRNSLLDAEEADSRADVAGQALALAEESLRLVEAEYQGGKASITRLLETELALTHARTRRSAAAYDRALSRIAIAHATGEYPSPPALVSKEER
jgi:outer membrane protein